MQVSPQLLYVLLLCATVSGCLDDSVAPAPSGAAAVVPTRETAPVRSSDDAADDPAIWLHPDDPGLSLVIGTDKQYGLEVYNLAGERVQALPVGRTNNVDLRTIQNGGNWSAIAAASNRSTKSISLFAIDTAGRLSWLEQSEITTGLDEPYGLCLYHGPEGLQVFVNDTDGSYQQWGLELMLTDNDLPRIEAQLLREFAVSSQPEGCVADDARQRLFVGVEGEGIRVLDASPVATATFQVVANIDNDILVADVEGMSLYLAEDSGYLVVSSQGNYSYAVYDRNPPHQYRGSFVVVDSPDTGIDGSQETDGLDVSSLLRTADFPEGLLVVQDGFNTAPDAAQNFKYISWQQIRSALNLQ